VTEVAGWLAVVCSAMEAEPGDARQHNEDVADVNPGSVGQQESHTAAASRHRGHAATLCQQEGLPCAQLSITLYYSRSTIVLSDDYYTGDHVLAVKNWNGLSE